MEPLNTSIIRTIFIAICVMELAFCMPLQENNGYAETLKCKLSGLAKYNLTFEGLWSEQKFPKQFPLFRPNAQWSKAIARSHSNDYSLWSMDSQATKGFKLFAEKGTSEDFDTVDEQGRGGILDLFQVSPIVVSVGAKWATFFADERHHKVSMASKIVPSPDWFVGVDSLDLCQNNDWVEYKEVNLDPIDAGTDKGFTFSSPNWMESPYRPIFQITSNFPDHPANSFYYPQHDQLPTIARIIIRKIKVYGELGDVHEHDEDEYLEGSRSENDVEDIIEEDQNVIEQEVDEDDQDNEVTESIIVENRNYKDIISYSLQIESDPKRSGVIDANLKSMKGEHIIEHYESEPGIHQNSHQDKMANHKKLTLSPTMYERTELKTRKEPTTKMTMSPSTESKIIKTTMEPKTTTKMDITKLKTTQPAKTTEKIIAKYFGQSKSFTNLPLNDFVHQNIRVLPRKQTETTKKPRKGNKNDNRKRKNRKNKKQKRPVNCVLGEWADWSPCSKTCGYGVRTRERIVEVKPRRGGNSCKQYPQNELCGSMRTCTKWKHFSFDNWGMNGS